MLIRNSEGLYNLEVCFTWDHKTMLHIDQAHTTNFAGNQTLS